MSSSQMIFGICHSAVAVWLVVRIVNDRDPSWTKRAAFWRPLLSALQSATIAVAPAVAFNVASLGRPVNLFVMALASGALFEVGRAVGIFYLLLDLLLFFVSRGSKASLYLNLVIYIAVLVALLFLGADTKVSG